VGINAYRSGEVIQKTVKNLEVGGFYVLVISGTDANEFIYMDDKREAIKEACENADYIISLS